MLTEDIRRTDQGRQMLKEDIRRTDQGWQMLKEDIRRTDQGEYSDGRVIPLSAKIYRIKLDVIFIHCVQQEENIDISRLLL